mmetsp:Transcript_36302/g.43870  ORF Transcript_36302/g.43870 Transcript_36302/m.43870 type:complete len:426 (+) Transcript_36302:102-1379(+)|eukprot:CAMPEP_0197861942 /NCGR_PEP_ID=MMETSP1438-20131217/38309_1 /TAXON_ID=1461541 /ORGANISM="Pterosperma sp., Strain CCMP1384" /LENGTH=425 /DNA_ID=CAMNT_0043479305 /DNA_START=92 /DNA_END=1369 /DNA_ORIENTATION=+
MTYRMGTPQDWRNSSMFGMDKSQTIRTDSVGNREHAAQVDAFTRASQKGAQNEVNDALEHKLGALQGLISNLTQTHTDGIPVLQTLNSTKALTEKHIADKTRLHTINQERKAIRLSRPPQENVYDPAQEMLDAEDQTIQGALENLRNCLANLVMSIKKMDSMQSVLAADIKDKTAAETLEKQCIGPQRFNKFGGIEDVKHLGSHTSKATAEAQVNDPSATEQPSSWAAKTEENVNKGKATQADALALCETVEANIKHCDDEITKAHKNVQHALKEKLLESSTLWESLCAHKAETEAEIASCLKAKSDLESAIAHKTVPLNTAQTRYDIRAKRPERELVEDSAHTSLKSEISQITTMIQDLKGKLAETVELLAKNNQMRDELIADIDLKETSIDLDCDCMVYPGKKDARLARDIPQIKKYAASKPY